MARRVFQSIELDQSLRRSRGIWLSLAIFAVPFAVVGLLNLLDGLTALVMLSGNEDVSIPLTIWSIIWGSCLILLDISLFRQVREAGRRLRILKEDPNANVRPLPAPFQASMFGPYH